MNLIIFILAVLGITNIITREHIFSWLRDKLEGTFMGQLVTCPTCTSFWVGASLFFILSLPYSLPISILLSGAIGSIVTKIVFLKLFNH